MPQRPNSFQSSKKYVMILCVQFMLMRWMVIDISPAQEISGDRAPIPNNRLLSVTASLPDDSLLVWVIYRDKPYEKNQSYPSISQRALQRRFYRGKITDSDADLPVSPTYIRRTQEAGLRLRHVSRWLNAVSGKIHRSAYTALQQLSFVDRIEPVRVAYRRQEPFYRNQPTLQHNPYSVVLYDSAFYGMSYRQNQLVKVPALHQRGYAGQDVVLAVFDAGFNNLSHKVFDSLRVLATRDFVNGDSSVADDPGQAGYGGHGTMVLSVLAGYDPGKLIGPAFRAQYLLAKTENTDNETPAEEDNWIAALEWAELYGADIVSSSVGYLGMDPGSIRSYNWTWMNGDSTLITKAANRAAERGLIIVNSAGNEYANASRNTLLAPADGIHVIAVGSVTSSRVRSAFSSVGPTTAGRIKPDVMAMGSGVTVASTYGYTDYFTASGTSFSCPMVAGICAQILSAFPTVSSKAMMNALHRTSDRYDNPDNLYGYGIVSAERLYHYFLKNSTQERLKNYPNPFYTTTSIHFYMTASESATIAIYNVSGQKVRLLMRGVFPEGKNTVLWNGRDDRGNRVASGVYICRIETPSWKKSAKMLFLRN